MVEAAEGHPNPWTKTTFGLFVYSWGCCFGGVNVAVAMNMRIYAEFGGGNVYYFVYDD